MSLIEYAMGVTQNWAAQALAALAIAAYTSWKSKKCASPANDDDRPHAMNMRSVRNSLIVGALFSMSLMAIMFYSLGITAKSDLPLTRMVMAEFVIDAFIAAYMMKITADLVSLALDAHTRNKRRIP